MTTPSYNLPYVPNGLVGGEVLHNDGLNKLDALVGLSVVGFDTNAPPGSPTNGQCWKIGGSPTGSWVANADEIAVWNDGWGFISPKENMFLFDETADVVKRLSDLGADTWVEYGHQGAAVDSLTNSTGGSSGLTLGAVSGSGDDSQINNNFASLLTQLNALLTSLEASKSIST